MVRIFLISLALTFAFFRCGGNKRPNPQPVPIPVPTPTASPVVEPSPVPSPVITPTPGVSPAPINFATPYPTPNIDPASYLPAIQPGKTVTVSGENLADKLQAAQDDPSVGTVRVEGGGSIAKQVILRKHTVFDSSTYSCDVQGITDYGVFLIADGVVVEGTWRVPQALLDYFKFGNGHNWRDPYLQKVQALSDKELAGSGTTILEPTFVADYAPLPAIEVFQALGDSCCSHTDKAHDIAVIGFHIKGRQKVYDGGVRSTILLGNCTHCTAQNNYLEDTASIGITAGGSAQEFRKDTPDGVVTLRDNHAEDVLFWHNVTSGVAAANIASINGEDIWIGENYARRPGHNNVILPDGKESVFGGAVCHVDFESNSEEDHTGGFVWNNLSDYEGAARTGNAMCLQDPYFGVNHHPIVAVNNVIIGGRNDNLYRYMTSGFFLNGLTGCHLSNNYVFRTGQNGIQAHSIKQCLIEDQDFESTGGGGNSTVWMNDGHDNVFRRNNYRERPGLSINTQAGFEDVCGSGNKYEDNRTLGEVTQAVTRCP